MGNLNINLALDDVKVFVLLDVTMVLWLCKKMLFLEMDTEAFWVKYLDGCDLILKMPPAKVDKINMKK